MILESPDGNIGQVMIKMSPNQKSDSLWVALSVLLSPPCLSLDSSEPLRFHCTAICEYWIKSSRD